MRPVSIQTFINVVYCEDDQPPSLATIRRRCPEIPGAFRDGRRWRIDLSHVTDTLISIIFSILKPLPAESHRSQAHIPRPSNQ